MITRIFRAACLSVVFVAWPGIAAAECFADLTGGDGSWSELIGRDPGSAVERLTRLRDAAGDAAAAAPAPDRAHLDAMLMEAYHALGDLPRALASANDGLASLAPGDAPGLKRRLTFRRLAFMNAMGQLRQAAQEVELAVAAVPDDAPERTCALAERGYLRLRMDRVAPAASDLIRAASLAKSLHNDKYRFEATGILSLLYAKEGFFTEAMSLADEAVAYYQESPDRQRLADAYFRRGDVYFEEGDYGSAEPDFAQALSISTQLGGAIDVGAAEQRMCRVRARLERSAQARRFCEAAYAHARPQDSESARLVLASIGEIELSDGHAAAAAALFDRALAQDGADLSNRAAAGIRRERGRARTLLGQAAGALQDMTAVVAWMDSERQTSAAERMALWHVKSALEEKESELARVRAAQEAAERDASRQALVRNAIGAAALIAVIAISVVAWLLRRRTEVEAARQAAESRLAAIGKLTAGIAHEFNNNLTVIQQAAGLLAQRAAAGGDEASRGLIREIDRSTRASADVTAQMLSFARLQHLKPGALNLGPYLAETLPVLQRIAGPSVTVVLDVTDALRPVWVDPRQLTAALLNLVANSRDAMGDGGKVTLRASVAGSDRVCLAVIDEGSGMPPDVLARATDPFFTTKPVGRGSGLGLSMVDGFVTQSGGEMLLHSEPGRGTSVSLMLPVAK